MKIILKTFFFLKHFVGIIQGLITVDGEEKKLNDGFRQPQKEKEFQSSAFLSKTFPYKI